jgi:CHAT domain-containing protein/Tfp pilus assembly protein PilF
MLSVMGSRSGGGAGVTARAARCRLRRGRRLTSLIGCCAALACGAPGAQRSPSTLGAPVEDDGVALDATSVQLYGPVEFVSPMPGGDAAFDERRPSIHGRGLSALDAVLGLGDRAAEHWRQGAYAKAEPLLVRALQVCQEAVGSWHPEVAVSLNNLAVLYLAQGAHDRAEPLLLRAVEIDDHAPGATQAELANSLSNLAMLYDLTGAYARAEPLYRRALGIREATLGAVHADVAVSLNNLAFLYSKQGAYAQAEPLYLRALAIHRKLLGRWHLDVALSLNNLAGLYFAQGAHDRAAPLMIQALAIELHALGDTHPYVATLRGNLASVYLARGEVDLAVPLMERAAETRELQLHLELARLSESRMRAVMAQIQGETELVVSLHADALPASPRALALALTTVLRRKGRILDALADNRRNLRRRSTPALRDDLEQLSTVATELSNQLRGPYGAATAATRASTIAGLRARFEALEASLNVASLEFRADAAPITIAAVQAALPTGAALVELVRYHRFDARSTPPWREPRYVAYVLPSQGPPDWVALGEAAPIDAAVHAALAMMRSGADGEATRAALQQLDALVLAPVLRVTRSSDLIVSPDGELNLVPFDALIDAQGRYEGEHRLVSYVTSGRDLLRLAGRRSPRSPALLVASPDYGPPRRDAVAGLGAFRPLAGASAELAELSAYFVGARTLTGGQATKAALAAVIGPAAVHVATHGFYARDASAAAPARQPAARGSDVAMSAAPSVSRGLRGMHVEPTPFAVGPAPASLGDPSAGLDRAGLAMAGANVRPDGIVSARELAGYDWWGTQLVVLSACETGVGAVPSGDGVYGMRRALVLAGAEAQVVSLWSVSDAATRALMAAFYAELARGTGRAEALRRAKLWLAQQPRYAHPYYWAAFILSGAWTALGPDILQRQDHD